MTVLKVKIKHYLLSVMLNESARKGFDISMESHHSPTCNIKMNAEALDLVHGYVYAACRQFAGNGMMKCCC